MGIRSVWAQRIKGLTAWQKYYSLVLMIEST